MNGRLWKQGCCAALTALLCAGTAVAQLPPGNPVAYPEKLTITITNPIDLARAGEPVAIPLAEIVRRAPDFNRDFFRVKRTADEGFEPLDIPSQICRIPLDGAAEELVFQIDLAPGERKTLEICYNPAGAQPIAYPARTAAFGKWYTDGSNVAWENEAAAYRSYNGVVDYFAKSYPHLRLEGLPPDSYHHEDVWGVDPFMIGRKPGLCGVAVTVGGALRPCYGGRDSLGYAHVAFGGGPVCSGAVVTVRKGGNLLLDEVYTLYAGRHENHVRVIPARGTAGVAVGAQQNDGEEKWLDAGAGYFVSWAPAGEYGSIAHILVFNPSSYSGTEDAMNGHFIRLNPSAGGVVEYLSLGAWYRVSADQPKSPDALLAFARNLARCFANPVTVRFVE